MNDLVNNPLHTIILLLIARTHPRPRRLFFPCLPLPVRNRTAPPHTFPQPPSRTRTTPSHAGGSPNWQRGCGGLIPINIKVIGGILDILRARVACAFRGPGRRHSSARPPQDAQTVSVTVSLCVSVTALLPGRAAVLFSVLSRGLVGCPSHRSPRLACVRERVSECRSAFVGTLAGVTEREGEKVGRRKMGREGGWVGKEGREGGTKKASGSGATSGAVATL